MTLRKNLLIQIIFIYTLSNTSPIAECMMSNIAANIMTNTTFIAENIVYNTELGEVISSQVTQGPLVYKLNEFTNSEAASSMVDLIPSPNPSPLSTLSNNTTHYSQTYQLNDQNTNTIQSWNLLMGGFGFAVETAIQNADTTVLSVHEPFESLEHSSFLPPKFEQK